jgi:hypothetical protein
MPFTILDASEPVITVKVSGELGKVEVSQIQAAALEVTGLRQNWRAILSGKFSRLETRG